MRIMFIDRPAAPRRLALAGAVVLALAGLSCSHASLPNASASQPLSSGGPVAEARALPAVNEGMPIVAPADTTTPPQALIEQLSVEQEQQRFVLPEGYRVEPVLAEPAIKEPAAIAFDGNGRMFVLELRGYMQDADATDELAPVGRVSMHEDGDGDGVYERHSVFVDSLVFPRFVLPFGAHSILTMESNEDEVYRFTDTDRDGVADQKELFTTNYGRSGNVEHQQAFMYWGLDNWLYSTYNAFRVRWDGSLREPTGANRAQWGVTQDDDGKIWFQGGASGLPSYFQFPIVYGNFDVENPFEEGFEVPYGLAGVGDFQPGPDASRPDGTLNRVTGSAGNDVVRGHRMPADLLGDYLYGEPVARIIRRIRPVKAEGVTRLRNVYQAEQSEFIRSTDPLFRPVDIATAPDGSIYVVDMYRGIIQEGQWTPRGSFLRAKIEQYNLDAAIGHGRIWRVVHEDHPRDRQPPRMLDETPAQLVRHLEHPNGWWRDTAQQLLVLSQDRSVVPALEAMARTSEYVLARMHALWTLEGLGALEASLVRDLLGDPEPRLRIQALRASETLYKAGTPALADDYRRLALDPETDVAVQALLTLDVLNVPGREATIQEAQAANPAEGVQFVANQLLAPPPDPAERWRFRYAPAEIALLEQGAQIYGELCAQCHGETGRGTPFGDGQTLAPSLANSARVQGHRDYMVQTLLHGLTGPIDGATYPGNIMVPMGENPDEWIAAVASFVRNSFTNEAPLVTPEQVARIRAATAERTAPWTYAELVASTPTPLRPEPTWTASASHNPDAAASALNFAGWSTNAPQEPGMWFQIALPAPVMLTEIQFNSLPRRRGWGPDAPPPQMTSPHGYRVQVSMDGTTWSPPVAEGQSLATTTTIAFEPAEARFVRITQTATPEGEAPPWSMQRLRLFTR